MPTITEYAVRVKGTQCYLTRPQRRDGRGGSHLMPIDMSKPKGQRGINPRYEEELQIRSYAQKKAAKNLLSSWLQGAVGCSRGMDGYDDYYEENYILKGSSREHMRDQMEIVEITITLPD